MEPLQSTDAAARTETAQLASERAAALAENRRRLSTEGRQSAEAARVRQSEQIAELRQVVAEAVGANTRLAIARAPEAPIFLYRAIDRATGEVVQEWPRLEFLSHARAALAAAMPETGAAIDHEA
jgi:hypothetical protein